MSEILLTLEKKLKYMTERLTLSFSFSQSWIHIRIILEAFIFFFLHLNRKFIIFIFQVFSFYIRGKKNLFFFFLNFILFLNFT